MDPSWFPHRPRIAAPVRPARQLTASQKRALKALLALGANLDADFTRPQLRSAFRRLAHRYHPDRHPREESERWTRQFAALRDSYDCLLACA